MCGHGVIGNRTAVLTEMQIRFADLEENLNAPASPIQADDFFFAKGHVGRNQYQIVFTPIAVMHIDKADRNCLAVLNGFRFYRKQLFSTATAFRILLVDCFNILHLALVTVMHLAGFLCHSDDVKTNILYGC